jgi:hypothetical protein
MIKMQGEVFGSISDSRKLIGHRVVAARTGKRPKFQHPRAALTGRIPGNPAADKFRYNSLISGKIPLFRSVEEFRI